MPAPKREATARPSSAAENLKNCTFMIEISSTKIILGD
jgi:hypothetical protein